MRHVGLLCWFPPVGNSRSKMAAFGKWADFKRVGGSVVRQGACFVRDAVAGGTRSFARKRASIGSLPRLETRDVGHPVLSLTTTRKARLDGASRAYLFLWMSFPHRSHRRRFGSGRDEG